MSERMIMISEAEYKQLKRKVHSSKYQDETLFEITKELAAKAISSLDNRTFFNLVNWAKNKGIDFSIINLPHFDKVELRISYTPK